MRLYIDDRITQSHKPACGHCFLLFFYPLSSSSCTAWLVNEIKAAPVISADAEKRQQHAIKDSATIDDGDDDMPRKVVVWVY